MELLVSLEVSECGLAVYENGQKILLDPRRESKSDVMFISHAHSDHLLTPRRKKIAYPREVLVSKATTRLAQARGIDIRLDNCIDYSDGYDLIDTGHILGSRGLLIPDQIYYTGDISTRQRGSLGGARVPRVDILIVESTFGLPRYVFPPVDEIVHTTNKIIGEMFDRGTSVILMGYPLGKAQVLTELFQHWAPLYIHESVAQINDVYRDFGVGLKEGIVVSDVKREEDLLEKTAPWVMIMPLVAARSGYAKVMKEHYGAVTIGFSGWAINGGYKFSMGLDYALPLSDHCDYSELVQLVLGSKARKAYTFHGFSEEFAQSLRGLGLNAESLTQRRKAQGSRIRNSETLDLYIQT